MTNYKREVCRFVSYHAPRHEHPQRRDRMYFPSHSKKCGQPTGSSGPTGPTRPWIRNDRDHYPLSSSTDAPIMDWTRGEIMAPATLLTLMAGMYPLTQDGEEEKDI